MAYGIHYTFPFKTLIGEQCHFDILEKDYTGDVLTLAGGGRSPVVHSWDASSLSQPVRGSKCVLQYVSKSVTVANGLRFTDEIGGVSPLIYFINFSGVNVAGVVTVNINTVGGSVSFEVPTTNGEPISQLVLDLIDVVNADPNCVAVVGVTPDSIAIYVVGYGDIITAETLVPPPMGTILVPELPIETFLTNDETKFRGEMYLNGNLKFVGFMVIDDFSDPYLTPPKESLLTFTDGLSLLDQVTLIEAGYSLTSGKVGVNKLIESILLLTNLDIPVRQYYNLFPDGELNRDDNPAIDALSLQYLNIKTFLQNDDDFDNCKLALEKILKANFCALMQQDGVWTIVRQPEYKRFAGNIPGSTKGVIEFTGTIGYISGIGGNTIFGITGGATWGAGFEVGDTFNISYASNPVFDGDYTITAVTIGVSDLAITVAVQPAGGGSGALDVTLSRMGDIVAPELLTKTIGRAGDLIPTDRSQLKQYKRPTKTVTNTFNYRVPQLLTNSNLQRLGDFIGTSTSGDNTFNDYELSDWTNQNTAAAFIRVVTNTLTGKEIERYILMPWTTSPTGGHDSGVVGVPIEVNKGDRFSFNFRYRAERDENSNSAFTFGVALDTAVGRRNLIFYDQSPDSNNNNLRWVTALVAPGTEKQVTFPFKFDRSADNMTEWRTFNILDYDYNGYGMPVIPGDGLLYLFIRGFNHIGGGYPDYDTMLKDFQFEYFMYVNDSIQIIGQENKASQNIVNKNELSDEIHVDDSPKFNIAGTIFKKSGSSFIRTTDWIKASGETDLYRHGQINAVDELLLNSNYRTIFEGPFYNLCNPVDSFSIDGVEGLFIPYKLELDYRQNKSRLSLQEVSKDSDPSLASLIYKFRFLYK